MKNVCLNTKNNGLNKKSNIHSLFELEYFIIKFMKTLMNTLTSLFRVVYEWGKLVSNLYKISELKLCERDLFG